MAKEVGSGRKQIPLTNQLAATDFTPVAPTTATKYTISSQANQEESHSRVLSGQYHSCLL